LYDRLLSTVASNDWWRRPLDHKERARELREILGLSVRYASDEVLALVEHLSYGLDWSTEQQSSDLLLRERSDAQAHLVKRIRAELAGRREAKRTLRRYRRNP
jgi:hypothetical protein